MSSSTSEKSENNTGFFQEHLPLNALSSLEEKPNRLDPVGLHPKRVSEAVSSVLISTYLKRSTYKRKEW